MKTLFYFRYLTEEIEMSSTAISPDIEQWLLMDEKVRKRSQSVEDVDLQFKYALNLNGPVPIKYLIVCFFKYILDKHIQI